MKAPALTPVVTLVLTLLIALAGRTEAKGTPGGGDIHTSPAVGITNADIVSLNLSSIVPATNAQGHPNGPCDVAVKFLDASGADALFIVTLTPQQSVPVEFTFGSEPFAYVRVVIESPPTGQGNPVCDKQQLKGVIQVRDAASNETRAMYDSF